MFGYRARGLWGGGLRACGMGFWVQGSAVCAWGLVRFPPQDLGLMFESNA